MSVVDDDTIYTQKLSSLESWERHLQRLEDIMNDLPETLADWDGYGLRLHLQSAQVQVETRRNKLFPDGE
jgi:hypothetical protein